MAWREVTTGAIDIKKSKQKAWNGVYLGSRGISTKMGSQIIYRFQDIHGFIFQIYGFTNLNILMESIGQGQNVRITYLGTKNLQTKFGMKDVHQVKVEVEEIE